MKNVVKICVPTWSIFAGPVTYAKFSEDLHIILDGQEMSMAYSIVLLIEGL